MIVLAVLSGVAHFATRRVSTGPLRTLVEKNLTQALGLEVTIDKLIVALLPTPHLHAEGVRVANLPDRSSPYLLSIHRVDLRVALWPLLARHLVIDGLTIAGADLHVETDKQGRIAGGLPLGTRASDVDKESLAFELRRLNVETARVFYEDPHSGTSHSLQLDSVGLKSKRLRGEISLEARGEFLGSKISLSGEFGSLRELLNPTRPFPLDLEGQLFEAHFEAKGSVREPSTLAGLDLEISAEIPELVVLGHSLPQLGAIRFGGHLSDLDEALGLEQIHLDTTRTDPVQIDVRGKIDDLLALKGVDIEADVETRSLDFLTPLLQPRFDFPLPAIASLSAKTRLSHQKDGLTLDGTLHAATTGDAIVINAKGSARDLVRVPKLDVQLDARAHDLASITAFIPDIPKHGALGPVTASARLKSHDRGLAASGIEIRIGDRQKAWVELDGTVADLAALRDVDLELNFGAESLHHLKELLESELPSTSPIRGTAAISDKDGALGLEHLHLHGGQDSPFEIHLDARFDDLPGRDEIEIDLGLRSEDTRVLAALSGFGLPVLGPFEFRGKVLGSDEHLEAENVTLRLGETHLDGSLSGSFASPSRPSAKARLASKYVRLQDLGVVPASTASLPSNTPAPNTPDAPDAPEASDSGVALPFEHLRHVDLDLGLQIDRVGGYAGFDARDVRFMLRLEDGELVVTDATARYQGGQLSAELSADSRTPMPKLKVALHTDGIDLARLMSQFQKQTEYSGLVDADLDLKASGGTLDALRQSLAGSVGVSIRDGNVASRIGQQFVFNLIKVAFPFMHTKEVPSIGCAVASLGIEDGIAIVHTLLLKDKEVSVTGTGKIDLVHGLYDLRVVPKTTNPGILGFVPEVLVEGPLDDPRFHSVKRTLATSFGQGLFKNAIKAGGAILRPFRSQTASEAPGQDECHVQIPAPR